MRLPNSDNTANVIANLFNLVIDETRTFFGNLFTKVITIIRSDGEDSVAGEGRFNDGQIKVEIENSYMTANSQVFITMLGSHDGYYITDKVKGGFTVNLNSPAEGSLEFDYLIVVIEDITDSDNPSSNQEVDLDNEPLPELEVTLEVTDQAVEPAPDVETMELENNDSDTPDVEELIQNDPVQATQQIVNSDETEVTDQVDLENE